MKFFGTFEISGISRLVIDKTTVWVKEITKSGQIVWRKEHTERRKPDRYILGRIQHFINDEEYRVWFHNETCNVEKLPKIKTLVEVTLQTHKTARPRIVEAHDVQVVRHGSRKTTPDIR